MHPLGSFETTSAEAALDLAVQAATGYDDYADFLKKTGLPSDHLYAAEISQPELKGIGN